jgi:hypothetical protein
MKCEGREGDGFGLCDCRYFDNGDDEFAGYVSRRELFIMFYGTRERDGRVAMDYFPEHSML